MFKETLRLSSIIFWGTFELDLTSGPDSWCYYYKECSVWVQKWFNCCLNILWSVFYVIVKLWLPLSFIMWRFQTKQVHHREQQTERVDRDGQRSRPQNVASSGSSNSTSVNSVNNRVSGFSRTRDARDGDEYTRSEQHLQENLYEKPL